MKISHLIYKVDNLTKAVQQFETYGFTVEYGKKEEPYNALIYMNDHTYIELIQNQNITPVLVFLLKLFGMRDYLESSLEQEQHEEGFMRFAVHMKVEDKRKLREKYKNIFGAGTFWVPIQREDIHGNRLKCKCLMPSNATLPFFNTEFACENLWNVTHKNGVVGIKKVVYSATDLELEFFKGIPVDERIVLMGGGKGIVEIEFVHKDSAGKMLKYCNKQWKSMRLFREKERM